MTKFKAALKYPVCSKTIIPIFLKKKYKKGPIKGLYKEDTKILFKMKIICI